VDGERVPFSRNKHKTDIVAYLTIIGWLIAWFWGDRAASHFHLNQALSVLLADLGLNLVFALATLYGVGVGAVLLRGVCGLLSFCTVVLWVMAFVRACKGSEKPVPVLGEVQLLK
jgi:uncharacterized membrane protein